MILGNYFFSPEINGSEEWWMFRFNSAGIIAGIVGALKRNAMIVLSYAWLSCTSTIPEIYESLSFVRTFNKNIAIFLKWLQNINKELTGFNFSLFIRGLKPKFLHIKLKSFKWRLILTAVIRRIFYSIGKMTYAGESHNIFVYSPADGSIEIRDLSVRYNHNLPFILKNINLEIEQGEFVYLGGPDGSGKTSLLRAISGYIPRICGDTPRGQIKLSGKILDDSFSVANISQYLRFIIQNPSEWIIGLTVGHEIMSVTDNETFARQCLSYMNIEDLWDRETTKLSGGEQVRLVLASLLASNARIILLDSPLSQLDLKGRSTFIEALDRLIKKNRPTVIVADQFIEYYKPLITHFILLDRGEIKEDIKGCISFDEKLLKHCHLISEKMELSSAPILIRDKNPLAQLRDVHLTIDKVEILKGVDMEIFRSECVAVMGENGSGKTSAMLVLAEAIKPTKGFVTKQGKVRYVFQDASLQVIESTVYDELAIGPKIRNWSSDELDEFTSKQVEWAGLNPNDETLDLISAKLRLLAIADMNIDVDIMIFDEPTADIDVVSIKKIVQLIDSLVKLGVAVLLVTHDKRIAQIASRIIVMKEGRVIKNTTRIEEVVNAL
jgi:energy-coupling factor transport system ATP-binding protein